jgi:lipid A oxidase
MSKMILGAVLAAGLAAPAAAEVELSFYTGTQSAPHSSVSGTYPGGGSYDSTIAWEGRSFEMPPYYGVRATWWQDNNWGYGVEFSHNKVYANDADRAALGFSRLEFTDGLNLLTVNATKRWPELWGKFSPYAGAGIGLSIPHVDVEHAGGKTFEYQATGAAVRLTAGTSYQLNDRFSVFGEYQMTYSQNKADLTGGGTLETNIVTNALNIGVSMSF